MAYISQLEYEQADEKHKKVIDEWVSVHGPLKHLYIQYLLSTH